MSLKMLSRTAAVIGAVALLLWLYGLKFVGPAEPSARQPDGPPSVAELEGETLDESNFASHEPAPQVGALAADTRAETVIAAFADWTNRFMSADTAGRIALVDEGIRLARERRPVFKQLIQDDPREALAKAVPMVVRQQLPTSIVALLEERISGTGPLEVLAASPDSDPSEPIYRHIVTLGDREWRAFVYGRRTAQMSLESTMMNGVGVDSFMALDESPVRPLEVGEIPDVAKQAVETCPVSGLSTAVEREPGVAPPPVETSTPAIEAGDQIIYLCDGGHIRQFIEDTLAAEGNTGAPTSATSSLPVTRKNSTGVRRYVYMRVIFPDRLDECQTEKEAWSACRQLDEYFREISYGKLSFQGAVTPTILLPRTEASYKDAYTTSGSNSPIMNDAKQAARELGYPPENYHHFVVIYSGGPGTFGGLGSVNGTNTWLRSTSIGTFRHEIGHNIGVWHSNFWNTGGESTIGPGRNQEYGHHQDVMGSSGSGGHFNASMKRILEWLTPETYHPVTSSGLYRIHQFDQANQDPDLRYAIEIPKDPEREYWIEFRQKLNSIPWYENGASINWSSWGRSDGDSTLSGSNRGTQLLDMTPGTADDRNDSPLVIGRTFSDYEADVHITPVGKGGTTPESLDVQVHIGTTAGNSPPTLAISTSATSIAAGGSVTFTATSTDPDGDALAYHWNFGDKQPSHYGPTFSTDNSSVQTKTFATAGWYAVQCTVSDMKGGAIRDTVLIQVGTPTTYYISGTVTDASSDPVYDVRVHNGLATANYRGTSTDSDGDYFITNLAAGSHTLSVTAAGYTFSPLGFSNPVTVGPNQTGKNFSAAEVRRVSMEIVDGTATEGGDTATFRLVRSGSTAAAETVYVNFSGSAATADYSLSPAADTTTASPLEVFIIPAGQSSLDIVLTATQDTTSEGPETLEVTLLNAGDTYLPVGVQTLSLTIDDDDTSLPRVTFAVTDDEASEGAVPDSAVFTVTRTGSTAAPLTVNFSTATGFPANAVAAYAINGTDYTSTGSSVVIPAGQSSAPITIVPINDALVEGVETVLITLSTNAAYIRGTTTALTVKIIDDDIPDVTIAATDATANENGDTATFTITRTGATTEPLTVHYSSGGDALHGIDYQPLAGYVTIAAGQTSAEVLVIPIDDDLGEAAQSIVLQLRSASHYRVVTPSLATASLVDDGDLPMVALNIMDGVVAEKSSPDNGSFRITTTGTGTGNITVNYQVTGTAVSGDDFAALPGSLSIGKNTSSNITVTILNDSIPEDAETIVITLLPGAAYQLDSAFEGTMVIRDDDAAQMVSVSTDVTTVTEGGTGRFFFARSGATTDPLDLTYTLGGTVDGSDYTAPSGTVTIPAAAVGAYVDIVTTNDSLAEGVETLQVTIDPDNGSPRTYGLETPVATLKILDNDSGFTNTLAFAETSRTVSEDAGTITVSVNRTGGGVATTSCSVEYAVRFSTALGAGVDFQLPPGRLDFGPGEDVKTIPVEIIDDRLTEGVEAIILELRDPTLAAIASNTGRSTVFILDNEPRISIEASDPFAYEPADTATFRISRSGTTVGALVVPLAVSGTAVSGVDFTALPSSVTIPDGAAFTLLTLTPLANAAVNAPLTVELALAPSGTSLPGLRSSATATIGDAESDNPPFLHLVSPLGDSPGVPSNVSLRLAALAADDTPGSLTTTWSKLSGPGTVTFEDAASPVTGARFSTAGAYTLRLTASDGGQSTTLDVPLTVGAPVLPWTETNIGTTTYEGSAAQQHGLVSFSASGVAISGTTDRLFFRHRRLNGDGEVIARVRNLLTTNANARIGVMIRDSTANNAKMTSISLAPAASYSSSANRSSYLRRISTSISALNSDGAVPSGWVRLKRLGNVFTAYDSPDGVNWTQRGQDTIPIATNAYAGIAVTSGTNTDLTLGEVDQVRIIGTPDNNGPLVDAGSSASVLAGGTHNLAGSISDDALPESTGAVAATWSLVSGPASPVFTDAEKANTSVVFPAAGTYTLRLTADDGEVVTSDEVVVTATLPSVTVAATTAAAESGLSPGAFTLTRNTTTGDLTVQFTLSGTAVEGTDYAAVGTSVLIPDGSATAAVTVTPLADAIAEGSETIILSLAADAAYTLGTPSSDQITLLDLPSDNWLFEQYGEDANNPAFADPMADLDFDGLPNLLEYAFGVDPQASEASPVTSSPATVGPDKFMRIVVPKNAAATDVVFTVEATSDLRNPASWSSDGLIIESETATQLIVRDTVPMSSGQRYLRVRVSQP
ncbi:MAG: Calx-beta domain-containing protein [Prosthecobacter sp.]